MKKKILCKLEFVSMELVPGDFSVRTKMKRCDDNFAEFCFLLVISFILNSFKCE